MTTTMPPEAWVICNPGAATADEHPGVPSLYLGSWLA